MLKDFYTGKKILITGGLGFIGSAIARIVSQHECEVNIIDNLLEGYGGNIQNIKSVQEKIKVHYLDIRSIGEIESIVSSSDIIFSLAGQTSHSNSMAEPIKDLDINLRSQIELLEICRRKNPEAIIIYASTRQIYGQPIHLPVDEKHPINPLDVNGINNDATEKYLDLYRRVFGLQTFCLRLTNTYGPGQQLKGNHQGFTGIFIRKAINSEHLEIYGDGHQVRDFNYVDDVANAFIQVASQHDTLKYFVFNLGSNNHYSILNFVHLLQTFCSFEFSLRPFPIEKKKIDIGDYYANYNLIKKEVGWAPKVDLKSGLKETVLYFQENKEHYL